jgi:hypothetical protein
MPHAVDVAGNAASSQDFSDLDARIDALQQSAEVKTHSVRRGSILAEMHDQ